MAGIVPDHTGRDYVTEVRDGFLDKHQILDAIREYVASHGTSATTWVAMTIRRPVRCWRYRSFIGEPTRSVEVRTPVSTQMVGDRSVTLRAPRRNDPTRPR